MADTSELSHNQNLVLGVLTDAAAPLSAYTILTDLNDHGLRAPTQVYRALDKLLALGLVHKLETLNAFVACRHKHGTEHGATVFAICTGCGDVAEFADTAIDQHISRCAVREHFDVDSAIVELRGVCGLCSRDDP